MKKLIFVLMFIVMPAQAQENMSKPMWASDILASVPDVLCQPNQNMMACFDTDAAACASVLEKGLQACIDARSSDIPDMLNPAEQVKWGSEVGVCAGERYKEVMAAASKPCDAVPQESQQTSKSEWSQQIMELPQVLCQANQFFMTCYEVSAVQCAQALQTSLKNCLAEFADNVPDSLSQSDNAKWSSEVGKCIGADYNTQLISKKKSTHGC
jgi:hypothetical protein